jgi:hypothetical protein
VVHKRSFLVLASMLALCSAIVEAKTITLTPGDRGIFGVMHNEHCNPLLLSRIMRDSRILESQFDELAPGTAIVVPDECATQEPTHEEARVSRQIFITQSVLKSVEGLTKKNKSLMSDLAQARVDMAVMSIKMSNFLSQIHSLKDTLALRQQENKTRFWMLCGCIAFTSSLSLVLCIVLLVLRSKQKGTHEASLLVPDRPPSIPTGDDVVLHGELIPFRDTTKHTCGCPFCPETEIRNDLEAKLYHLATKHPHLQVREIISLKEWEKMFGVVS